MNAILIKSFGGPDQLYVGHHEMPTLDAESVLIKVSAAGVNRADVLQRTGKYPPPRGESEILGLEVSGIVESVGESCTKYKPDDKVMALCAGGGYAQYVKVPQGLVMPIPTGVSLEEAAAIPEVFITAYQVLFAIGKLNTGEWVLIHAGASGVGTAAIQLAKAVDAKVIVTVGTQEKAAFCEQLGADLAINYKQDPEWQESVREITNGHGADLIIDPVGASYFHKNLAAAAVDGRWILIAGMGGVEASEVNLAKILIKRISLIGSTLRSRSLAYKSELIDNFSNRFLHEFDKALKPVIHRMFDYQDVAEAHAFMEDNRNIGKLLLTDFNR